MRLGSDKAQACLDVSCFSNVERKAFCNVLLLCPPPKYRLLCLATFVGLCEAIRSLMCPVPDLHIYNQADLYIGGPTIHCVCTVDAVALTLEAMLCTVVYHIQPESPFHACREGLRRCRGTSSNQSSCSLDPKSSRRRFHSLRANHSTRS